MSRALWGQIAQRTRITVLLFLGIACSFTATESMAGPREAVLREAEVQSGADLNQILEANGWTVLELPSNMHLPGKLFRPGASSAESTCVNAVPVTGDLPSIEAQGSKGFIVEADARKGLIGGEAEVQAKTFKLKSTTDVEQSVIEGFEMKLTEACVAELKRLNDGGVSIAGWFVVQEVARARVQEVKCSSRDAAAKVRAMWVAKGEVGAMSDCVQSTAVTGVIAYKSRLVTELLPPDFGRLRSGTPAVPRGATRTMVTGSSVLLSDLDLGEDIVNDDIGQTAFLVVTSQPSGATVYLNGAEKGTTPYQEELPWGRYRVTLHKGLYHPAQQDLQLDSKRTREVPFSLKPAFGSALVQSVPAGAMVYLDGEMVGRTPLKLTGKPSRTYQVRVEAPDHKPYVGAIEILDEQMVELVVEMDSSVGRIQIDSKPRGAQVELNGEVVGRTPYFGDRKPPGAYRARLTLDKHLSQEIDFDLVEGTQFRRTIEMPPNYGSLLVESFPMGARIELRGKDSGRTTPFRFTEVQAGTLQLGLTLAGHGTWRGPAQVRVGEETVISKELQAMLGTLSIATLLPDGSACRGSVVIDGEMIGRSPVVHQVLATVPHDLYVECDGMKLKRKVLVAHRERKDLQLQVQRFTSRDLKTASRSVMWSTAVDGSLFASGLGALVGSALQLSRSSEAYQMATELTSASQGSRYQYLVSEGDFSRNLSIGLAAAGGGLIGTALWHHTRRTRTKLDRHQFIRSQVDDRYDLD